MFLTDVAMKNSMDRHLLEWSDTLTKFTHSTVLCFHLLLIVHWSSAAISPENTIVYGPGLKTDFFVPVRYFFIQAVGENGQK